MHAGGPYPAGGMQGVLLRVCLRHEKTMSDRHNNRRRGPPAIMWGPVGAHKLEWPRCSRTDGYRFYHTEPLHIRGIRIRCFWCMQSASSSANPFTAQILMHEDGPA